MNLARYSHLKFGALLGIGALIALVLCVQCVRTFLYAGKNITAYYRIQGPNLVIEYAPLELGRDPALHVHTMYRDPTNDYSKKLTAK